jgi:bifunctional ADP-heptose synthase (sugar kinase/adenylyltransferase)
VTHPDEIIDKYKNDGCLLPLKTRGVLLRALGCDDVLISTLDGDGTVAKTILALRPNVFVKDGDRNSSNVPATEIEACKQVGCEIVYLNNPKEASSSEIKSSFIHKWLAANNDG